jgi:hypothetical protein
MIDYSIFYKERLRLTSAHTWDIFISAFNSTERVQHVFKKISAKEKHWLVHPEYGYEPVEHPNQAFAPERCNEADFIKQFFETIGVNFTEDKICIDITGFMRPQLLFLLLFLKHNGCKKFDAIYSEPRHYTKKEKTSFSDNVTEVRQVAGFEGCHAVDKSNDILVIGTGYDHSLIAHAAENKDKARKVQIFGFPSLAPDMYQENILRAHKAAQSVGIEEIKDPFNFFAPANDPFVTANVLKDIVKKIPENLRKSSLTNLYLCPVGTKPQVLGFGLYFLTEWQDKAASIIFPFCESYSKKTTKGISRIWKYQIEFINPT